MTILSDERLVEMAATWRRIVKQWSDRAKLEQSPLAATYRHAGQMGLFAAHEADLLVRLRSARR